MGKKVGHRPRRATIAVDGDDDFDEGVSVTSFDTNDTYGSGGDIGGLEGAGSKSETSSIIGGGGVENGNQAMDDFKDAVDQLTERRASTRESGMRTVMNFMLQSLDLGPVLTMQQTLMQALIGVLRRKGTEAEGVQALKALSVLCVCMGPEEEEAYRTLRRPLRSLITRNGHPRVRIAAVHTLALACFICSSDNDNTTEALDLLARVFSRTSDGLAVPDQLVAAALSGWGLLATTVSRACVATKMTTQHLKVFRDLLRERDLDVRMEAGENLALLHESRLIMGLAAKGNGRAPGHDSWQGAGDRFTEEGEDGGDEAETEAEAAMDLTVLWEEVVEEMKGFISESSKKLSRETKKQQRRTFRQLFATIGDDEPPEEVVSLQNGSLTVVDWAHIKQLNALRSCLQSGFQAQMQSNELLREILGVSKWGGTGDEKLVYSKNSGVRKQQTTTRARSRNSKQFAQDRILSDTEGR